jgi:hypothetical protein
MTDGRVSVARDESFQAKAELICSGGVFFELFWPRAAAGSKGLTGNGWLNAPREPRQRSNVEHGRLPWTQVESEHELKQVEQSVMMIPPNDGKKEGRQIGGLCEGRGAGL